MSEIVCAHQYVPAEYPFYERCQRCGTYHSTAALARETLYQSGYWSGTDRSSLRDQIYNVDVHEENGSTKNAFVLDRIEVENRSAVLEIGCAPGSLLGRLWKDAGFSRVSGVEVDASYESDIREISGESARLIFGYFPEETQSLPACGFSLVVGCDVFEHAHDPCAFLAECARLVESGGQLLLMMPIVSGDVAFPDRFFCPTEHVFLHSERHLRMLLAGAGFEDPCFDCWTHGHETVSARRVKP